MIYQDNECLEKDIQHSGCYFLSLLFIAQYENEKELTVCEINDLYKLAVDNEWMKKDCEIIKPDKILNKVLKYKQSIQVGSITRKNEITFWGFVKRKWYNWNIEMHATSGVYGTHFIVNGTAYYDPLNGKGYEDLGISRENLYQIK